MFGGIVKLVLALLVLGVTFVGLQAFEVHPLLSGLIALCAAGLVVSGK